MTDARVYVGIDVAKDQVEVAVRPTGTTWTCAVFIGTAAPVAPATATFHKRLIRSPHLFFSG